MVFCIQECKTPQGIKESKKSKTLFVEFVGQDVVNADPVNGDDVGQVVMPVQFPAPKVSLPIDEHAFCGVVCNALDLPDVAV